MSTELDDAVELLDRSLAYTAGALAGVTDERLDDPTPCTGWTLRVLLAHMEDALDAFLEAAGGQVVVVAGSGSGARLRVEALQTKACLLLGTWVRAQPARVRVGGADLGAGLLVGTAALEVGLHGWDVSRATGLERALPDGLAVGLLPVAHEVVREEDRGLRFAPPRPAVDGSASAQLLAFTGRS
ncbi:TIGR03086 family metal-binding protein [Nocardioides pantholopis]|uniref:TIGR03086 family metal-binding protein n=1 Tax=Nocardioides pantholopis TaxID=2483798 RepID=UPI000F098B22|nr:TIGR03086 family metal-binding protein [Nocardioides pantholopis]